MEYTNNYYLPIAHFLQNNELFISVINAIPTHDYGNKSLHKAKTDKKGSLKLALSLSIVGLTCLLFLYLPIQETYLKPTIDSTTNKIPMGLSSFYY